MTQMQTDEMTNGTVGSETVIVAENVEKWYDNNFHVLRASR
jgi:general L-amino acid transport system ATP-binding protein